MYYYHSTIFHFQNLFFVSFSSIKVTIYAVKNPTGNTTDLSERLSRVKEYLTRDDILDALLDEDGNLSPNLTNDKELEVSGWYRVTKQIQLHRRGNRFLKIEVFRHFPRTGNVKKSCDHCVGVRFAVCGSRLYG